MVRVPDAQSDCSCRGEAEVRILNFKTTWSEFQKSSQTAAERGEAELRMLDFETTWSEFQKPSQTATEWVEAELPILDFKITWLEFQKLKQTVASNSIPLPLHVVLESSIHRSTFPCSVVVWLGFWNSEHDETRKWAMGQQDGPSLLGHCHPLDWKMWMLK